MDPIQHQHSKQIKKTASLWSYFANLDLTNARLSNRLLRKTLLALFSICFASSSCFSSINITWSYNQNQDILTYSVSGNWNSALDNFMTLEWSSAWLDLDQDELDYNTAGSTLRYGVNPGNWDKSGFMDSIQLANFDVQTSDGKGFYIQELVDRGDVGLGIDSITFNQVTGTSNAIPTQTITITGVTAFSPTYSQYTMYDASSNVLATFTAAVPEPSTYGLLIGTGCLFFCTYRRRGKRNGSTSSRQAT